MFEASKWGELSDSYKSIVQAASKAANADMLQRYDILNPDAIRTLVADGTILRPFNKDILEASFTAASEVYTDLSASNADFKSIYDSLTEYRGKAYLWFQIAEYNYDTFMMVQQRASKL
jgi:TRAP-type mannitol/chloroaromatic compound transport system substrate-binding protein